MIWKRAPRSLIAGVLVYIALGVHAVPTSVSSLTQILSDPLRPARADISGTRLKTKYIAGADGSQIAIDDVLWDSELATNCTFRTAADGSMRCLPRIADVPAGTAYGYVMFRDAACTDGLVWVAPSAPGCAVAVPAYAIVTTDPPYCSGESGRQHIYPVTGLLPPQSGPFYTVSGDGSCTSTSAPQTNGIPYQLGAEMTADSFASGTAEVDR